MGELVNALGLANQSARYISQVNSIEGEGGFSKKNLDGDVQLVSSKPLTLVKDGPY